LRKCDVTGERVLSIYSDKAKFPVYKYDFWVSDEWQVPSIDFDFNKSFFEQYADLSGIVPRPHSFVTYNENCDYVSSAEKNRNCYMHYLSDRCEDCMYTHGIYGCRDVIDSAFTYDSELCYDCCDCRRGYHLRGCFLCDNCSDLSFCFDMRGCKDCFFSHGLRNQQYVYFNKQLTREDYEAKMSEINLKSFKVFDEFKKKFISEVVLVSRYEMMVNTENCSGGFQFNTKNCFECYDVENAEDCSYLRIGANGIKDVHHSHAVVDGSELIMGDVSTTESYYCHNVIGSWTCNNCCYSEFLQGCSDCIGCISLKRKKYCIFNKQYSKEDYEKIKAHIVSQLGEKWGSPFPFVLAPFSYTDSAFRDYNSFTKEEVEKFGWRYGEELSFDKIAGVSVESLPDSIDDFSLDGTSVVYECPVSSSPFKITKQEVGLLKKIGAPLPRNHQEVRFRERVKFRNKK